MKKLIFLCVLYFFTFSCNKSIKTSNSINYKYNLELLSNNDLHYKIDNNTKFRFPSLFPYKDKSGKEYLTFMSHTKNEILFYDLLTSEYLFNVKLEIEGPDEIGRAHV